MWPRMLNNGAQSYQPCDNVEHCHILRMYFLTCLRERGADFYGEVRIRESSPQQLRLDSYIVAKEITRGTATTITNM